MRLSRRNFLDAATLLALSSPLAARAAVKGKAAPVTQDAVAMAQAVRDGRTTPRALVEAAITRLEKANPQVNCVALPNFERALEQAEKGVTGPLAGVPTLIKDNIDQKGLPNTNALKLFQSNIAAKNDPYVDAIERAGLISIGRSTLPELASNVTTESALTGITRNPWNPDYTSGGSSGGASAAVAAGVVPIAHGNDYAGSIR
ncbi:MAG TPA: amidase family protein, partial [Sphingopyxis sp.]|nr:amidase family protein [Sphingopyxis sp.]